MITRKHDFLFAEAEREMIYGVTWSGNCLKRPGCAADELAVLELLVRFEGKIAAGIKPVGFPNRQRPRWAMWSLRDADRAGGGLHRGNGRAMVAVGMRQ